MRALSEIEKVRERIDRGVAFHESALKVGTEIHERLAEQTDDKWRQGCYDPCEECGQIREDCRCNGTTEEELNE